jgi:hypothetical protein
MRLVKYDNRQVEPLEFEGRALVLRPGLEAINCHKYQVAEAAVEHSGFRFRVSRNHLMA